MFIKNGTLTVIRKKYTIFSSDTKESESGICVVSVPMAEDVHLQLSLTCMFFSKADLPCTCSGSPIYGTHLYVWHKVYNVKYVCGNEMKCSVLSGLNSGKWGEFDRGVDSWNVEYITVVGTIWTWTSYRSTDATKVCVECVEHFQIKTKHSKGKNKHRRTFPHSTIYRYTDKAESALQIGWHVPFRAHKYNRILYSPRAESRKKKVLCFFYLDYPSINVKM